MPKNFVDFNDIWPPVKLVWCIPASLFHDQKKSLKYLLIYLLKFKSECGILSGAKPRVILVGHSIIDFHLLHYWWGKIKFYVVKTRIIGGASAPSAPSSLTPLGILMYLLTWHVYCIVRKCLIEFSRIEHLYYPFYVNLISRNLKFLAITTFVKHFKETLT